MVFTCAVCLDFVYDRLRLQPQQPSSSFSSTSTSPPDLEPVSKQARLSYESNGYAACGGISTSVSNPHDNLDSTIPYSSRHTSSLGLTVQEIVNFSIELDPEMNYPVVIQNPEPEPVVKRKRGRPTRNSSRINSANGQSNDAGSSSAASQSPLEAQLKEILKPIKSDADQIIVTNCGHIFHLVCITRWLDSLATVYSGHCPECKRAIRSRKFTRIYPHNQEVAPLIEELESAKEREETLLQRIEMEKMSKDDYISYREGEFKYQMSLKEDRIADQSQQIKFLLGKLDSYKNKVLKKPHFDCNGALIDLTDDKTKTIIEVDLSSESSEDEQDENDDVDVTNIPLPQANDNEQEEIVID